MPYLTDIIQQLRPLTLQFPALLLQGQNPLSSHIQHLGLAQSTVIFIRYTRRCSSTRPSVPALAFADALPGPLCWQDGQKRLELLVQSVAVLFLH
jgi:hypothetical protein